MITLQDLELGRPLEIEALLGLVVEVAAWADVPVPLATALLTLVRQRAAVWGAELAARAKVA